jgi:hypothetical protein
MYAMKSCRWDAGRWMALASIATVAAGCGASHRMGKEATQGAVAELQKQAQSPQNKGELMEGVARHAVRGTLREFDDPVRQAELAELTRVVTDGALASLGVVDRRRAWGGGPPPDVIGLAGDRLSMGFTLGLSRQLQAELGPFGDGPLGQSVSGLARQVSAAAASGVVAQLPLDACTTSPSRLDAHVYDLSRSAAAGFADGIGGALRLPLLAASFLAGLLSALVVLVFTRSRSTRHERPAPRASGPNDWS